MLIGQSILWVFEVGDDIAKGIPAGMVMGDLLEAVGRAVAAVRRHLGTRTLSGLATRESQGTAWLAGSSRFPCGAEPRVRPMASRAGFTRHAKN
ncbi:hypothetical protein [Myceligenerans pegani]|uniref:Uncharacterized protein n=1 Tax=Myceligenerans pegani TaxID=2776917 RepID=A0ABR9MVQ5_9MICO|nr:hypothetical protein [Myceligenerans sp. TRM 65318]MBE1875200.1 hypothetical protein [Myceligenerans sp. TRM 65318]MBE3017471.1 hypothetical protein [Myceligenerans sp. TRM 65318]